MSINDGKHLELYGTVLFMLVLLDASRWDIWMAVYCWCADVICSMLIWLALWDACFAFTLVLWLVITYNIQCDYLVLMWSMLQSSLVHVWRRSGRETTSCNLTIRVISLGLGTRFVFLHLQPHSPISRELSSSHTTIVAVCKPHHVYITNLIKLDNLIVCGCMRTTSGLTLRRNV